MAWQYCRKCGHGMCEPTMAEALAVSQICPECGCNHHPLKSTEDLLIELYDRVVALESAQEKPHD